MSCYQDGNNYYCFSGYKERVYRRLVKGQDRTFAWIAADAVAYVPGWVYQVGIIADRVALEVWIDEALC